MDKLEINYNVLNEEMQEIKQELTDIYFDNFADFEIILAKGLQYSMINPS